MINRKLIATAVVLSLGGAAYTGVVSAADQRSYNNSMEYGKYRSGASMYTARASDMIGANVYNSTDDEIGEIDDIVVSKDKDSVHAVVSVGGFLGIGDKLVTVPYNEFRMDQDGYVYLDTTQAKLEALPVFLYNEGEIAGRDAFKRNVDMGPDMTAMDDSTWNKIEGNWKQFKGEVQQKWGELTNDDMDRIEGKRDELVGRIQERYGKTQAQAEQEVDAWSNTL